MDLSQPATDLLDLVGLVIRGVSDTRDLSLTALAVLRALQDSGAQRITALASAEGVSQPSMTQLVQRLELRGLVERTSDPTDGRVALVGLTSHGATVLAARRQHIAARVASLLAGLPEDDISRLADALAVVVPAIRERVGGGNLAVSGTVSAT